VLIDAFWIKEDVVGGKLFWGRMSISFNLNPPNRCLTDIADFQHYTWLKDTLVKKCIFNSDICPSLRTANVASYFNGFFSGIGSAPAMFSSCPTGFQGVPD